jgi:hypothetical protein
MIGGFTRLLLGATLVLLCDLHGIAQTTFGSVGGNVTDTAEASIPGVQVALTNVDTNGKQSTTTNSAGIYEFVNVLPGNYRIDAEKSTLKHFERSPVVVQVQQSIGLTSSCRRALSRRR